MNSSDFFRNSTTIIRFFFSPFFPFFCFNKKKPNITGFSAAAAVADKQI